MGPLGWQETVFIFVLALLIFGPKKLPELGKTIGKALTEFRRASSELKSTFDREMNALERETESLRDSAQSYTNDIYNADTPYLDSGTYDGSESYDSASSNNPTVSASAPQGAESTASTTATAADANTGKPPESQPAQNGTTHVAAAPSESPKLASDTQAVS